MNPVVMQAIELAEIAIPTMFAVTGLFIVCTIALKKVFPASKEGDN